MKNLGKTIDRIIKIDPELDAQLLPIRMKWEKYPKKVKTYWEQLLKVLNTEIGPQHPKRFEIQGVLTSRRKIAKKLYTFEAPTENERILGVIPEHLEIQIKRYDRMQIDIAKRGVEARLTHNKDLIVNLARQTDLLEIKQKKLWADVKDHFNLWPMEGNVTLLIRQNKDGCLVLTAVQLIPCPHGHGQEGGDSSFLMRLDPEVLRRFFKFLNIQPPPGFFTESE